MTEAETVRVVLEQARGEGCAFDEAWYRAQRFIQPPDGAPAELVDETRDVKAIMREVKPHFRAAYERRVATEAELEVGYEHARRRLRDLLCDEPDVVDADGASGLAA